MNKIDELTWTPEEEALAIEYAHKFWPDSWAPMREVILLYRWSQTDGKAALEDLDRQMIWGPKITA